MKQEVTVYHNARCSKSRCALAYLDDKNIEYNVIEYLKEIPTKQELAKIIEKLQIKPEDLLRKNEADYKSHFAGKTLSDDQWIEAMIQFPKLIERPIVVKNNRAVIARPTERIDEIV